MSIFVAYTMTKRTLTGLESVLWQIFVFAAGLSGSFIFGRESAQRTAREMFKPHARSAFRRLISLYQSLQRVATTIESSQKSCCEEDYHVTLGKLEAIVTEQLTTADDALEDWRDIVPEDVNEIHQKLRPGYTTEDTK
jgi:hypothetical protein